MTRNGILLPQACSIRRKKKVSSFVLPVSKKTVESEDRFDAKGIV